MEFPKKIGDFRGEDFADPPPEYFVHSKCAYVELVFSVANLT